ncbi:MAG TPA: GNAT family N-acetyltransferase [Rhodoglobus sp.]|nr:GNAT family N-acetyltransferase [Rhodoglobus sp.]
MSFAIRRPALSDAAAIAELHVSTWREAYGHLLPSDYFSADHAAGRRRMWARVLGEPDDDVTVHVAESDGSLVGFAWVGPGIGEDGAEPARERQLYAIYVAASHYGTGTGQALLDEALGGEPAMLWVAKENPRAIAFYLRNGFRFDGIQQTDPAAPSITDARMLR